MNLSQVTQDPVSLFSIRSTAQQLVDTRISLAKNMIVRVGGFEYESFFGCGDPGSGVPHVIVRVEMRPLREELDDAYHFEVTVDFNLFQGVSVKQAEELKREIDRAVKLAKWAHDKVRGLVWSAKTIASLEV